MLRSIPFEEFSWPFTDHNGVERYESFRERLYVPNNAYYKEWSFRCSGWTITDNGKHYRGHVEVLWRLTKQLEAYPQGPWNSPPYNTGFDNFTVAEALTAGHGNATLRPRDLLRVNSSESKARWTMANTIIAATYCDSLMRFPQYVWSRNLGVDPPSDPEDPGYWDPDDPIGFGNGPWPSSRWQAILARFMPTSAQRFWLEGPTVSVMEGFVNECLDEEDVNIPAVVFGILRHDATYCHNAPRTDFDVVDVQCVCCD
jgi:hypothetical protein